MPDITEDDLYRVSTQYRLWSFTRESIASLRSTTNATAAEGVRAAIKNVRSQKTETDTAVRDDGIAMDVDCLTVEEEQRMVGYYWFKTMQFADHFKFGTNVKASAIQYLKRFYLSNSPMTYHPKEIMRTALFLSTKTENSYMSLDDFTAKFPKTTREDVLAPEFLLCQGLRFTFDVRHPYRGLEGGYMELLALASGKGQAGSDNTISSAQIQQQEMKNLEPAKGGSKVSISAEEVVKRIEKAKAKANEVLKTSALLTDAYFLYTPSQIWLSAFYLVDKPLTRFYIDTKFPTPSELKPKLLNILRACADLLRSSPSADPGEAEMNELKKIDKKLYKCRNPEKTDLVGINRAQKREGAEDGLDEKTIKKRKLEREKSEKDAEDIFGPTLPTKKQ